MEEEYEIRVCLAIRCFFNNTYGREEEKRVRCIMLYVKGVDLLLYELFIKE